MKETNAERRSKLTKEQQAEFDQFMEAVRGVPAHRVAFALNRLTPTTDWRRCTKGMMAQSFAQRDCRILRSSLYAVTIERIVRSVKKIQQELG